VTQDMVRHDSREEQPLDEKPRLRWRSSDPSVGMPREKASERLIRIIQVC
jgi:hypothetical protein